jgi:hypothetical protein
VITLITLNDTDGTFIRTITEVFIIYKNFQNDGYSYILDIDGREHIITPKCISYICRMYDNVSDCKALGSEKEGSVS